MAEDPIRKYSKAMEELGKAEGDIVNIREIIGEVHRNLESPYNFTVANIDIGLPLMGGPTLNADYWPTAEQIAKALANLHQKRHQVDQIWHSLSPSDKNIVDAPPSK